MFTDTTSECLRFSSGWLYIFFGLRMKALALNMIMNDRSMNCVCVCINVREDTNLWLFGTTTMYACEVTKWNEQNSLRINICKSLCIDERRHVNECWSLLTLISIDASINSCEWVFKSRAHFCKYWLVGAHKFLVYMRMHVCLPPCLSLYVCSAHICMYCFVYEKPARAKARRLCVQLCTKRKAAPANRERKKQIKRKNETNGL